MAIFHLPPHDPSHCLSSYRSDPMIEDIDKLILELTNLRKKLVTVESDIAYADGVKQSSVDRYFTTIEEAFILKKRYPECNAARRNAVLTMKSRGYTHSETAKLLGLSQTSVVEIVRRAKQSEVHGSSD